MSIELNGTTGIDFNDGSNQSTAATPYARKNLIINGDMRIDQRNAGASVTIPAADQHTLDRWLASSGSASKFSVQQSSTSTTGFTNSLLVTSLSAYTVGAGEQSRLETRVEGLNCSHLAWGTANAQTVTLSFWTRSSLTGTFGGCLVNSAANRSYPFTYTISTANTWEQKSITIPGDTTGTWLTTNGIGIGVRFSVGSGSSFLATAGAWTNGNYVGGTGSQSILATNGATFYITGVQLEQNDSASDFEFVPYDMELARCQRYCYRFFGNKRIGLGAWNNDIQADIHIPIPTTMRIPPSITVNANGQVLRFAIAWYNISSLAVASESGESQIMVTASVGSTSGASRGEPTCIGGGGGSNPDLVFSAEL